MTLKTISRHVTHGVLHIMFLLNGLDQIDITAQVEFKRNE